MYTGKGGTIQSTREKRQWQNDELVLIKIWWQYCSTWTPITARKMVLFHKISSKDTVWMTDLLFKMGSKPHEWQLWSASRIWLDTTHRTLKQESSVLLRHQGPYWWKTYLPSSSSFICIASSAAGAWCWSEPETTVIHETQHYFGVQIYSNQTNKGKVHPRTRTWRHRGGEGV
jgi:hypothetical protein